MSGDIQNNWNSVASIAASTGSIAQYATPGGFNDLDIMVSEYPFYNVGCGEHFCIDAPVAPFRS